MRAWHRVRGRFLTWLDPDPPPVFTVEDYQNAVRRAMHRILGRADRTPGSRQDHYDALILAAEILDHETSPPIRGGRLGLK